MKQETIKVEELSMSYLDGDMQSLATGKIFNVYTQYTQEQDYFLTLIGNKLEKSKKILDDVLNKSRQNKYTKDLNVLNKSRKEQFSALDNILSGLSKKTGERAQAAKRILTAIHKHTTTLSNIGYAKCTRKINQITETLSSMEEDIQTAGVAEWITDLLTVHEQFKVMEKNKITYTIDSNTLPPLREARRKAADYLETILGSIVILVEEHPDIYEPMLAEINEIIGDIMAVARSKKTRNSHNDEQQEEKKSNAA